MYKQRKNYEKDLKNISKIQAQFRMSIQRKKFQKTLEGIPKIQAQFRLYTQRKKHQRILKTTDRSAAVKEASAGSSRLHGGQLTKLQ